jgi:hypothetical protein
VAEPRFRAQAPLHDERRALHLDLFPVWLSPWRVTRIRWEPCTGILCDIADAAMGLAYASTLSDGESMAAVELKINFLKPVWRANLRAIGRVVQSGKTLGLLECDIVDENDRLIAQAASTCMTLRGAAAAGR